jgi:hypothetical protein
MIISISKFKYWFMDSYKGQRLEQFCDEPFIGLAYQGKDIVFRFSIEYSSLRDFGP